MGFTKFNFEKTAKPSLKNGIFLSKSAKCCVSNINNNKALQIRFAVDFCCSCNLLPDNMLRVS